MNIVSSKKSLSLKSPSTFSLIVVNYFYSHVGAFFKFWWVNGHHQYYSYWIQQYHYHYYHQCFHDLYLYWYWWDHYCGWSSSTMVTLQQIHTIATIPFHCECPLSPSSTYTAQFYTWIAPPTVYKNKQEYHYYHHHGYPHCHKFLHQHHHQQCL